MNTKKDPRFPYLIVAGLVLLIACGFWFFNMLVRTGNQERLHQATQTGSIVRVNLERDGAVLIVKSGKSSEIKKYMLTGEITVLQDLPADREIFVEELPCSGSALGCFFLNQGTFAIHVRGSDDL